MVSQSSYSKKEDDIVGEGYKTKLTVLQKLLSRTQDTERTKAAEKRHKAGYRNARENLADLVDADSFMINILK